MISNCSKDERGKYRGGKAGDQTGGEWKIRTWYNRPWSHVLRFEDPEIAEMIATLSEEAAKNDNIGYDQSERTTFWKYLSGAGYHPKNIKVKCEADCSAGVAAIVKATGYLLNKSKLQAVSKDCYTGNLRKALVTAGASVYTAGKYLKSGDYLKRGDILLYEGHHTCINLTTGKNVKPDVLSVACERLNLRKGPGTKHEIINTLYRGDPCKVLEREKNGWYKVRAYKSVLDMYFVGYVNSKYLEVL